MADQKPWLGFGRPRDLLTFEQAIRADERARVEYCLRAVERDLVLGQPVERQAAFDGLLELLLTATQPTDEPTTDT